MLATTPRRADAASAPWRGRAGHSTRLAAHRATSHARAAIGRTLARSIAPSLYQERLGLIKIACPGARWVAVQSMIQHIKPPE